MRWKLIRRRLSVSAPRMIVRSHLPWPLRWAAFAVMFGFSAAIALWAFEFGKDLAGLDRDDKEELGNLRREITQLRTDHTRARQVADTADSLLKTERSTQQRLASQVRQLESDNQALQADVNFYQRLLPTTGEGLQLRGLQAASKGPGQLRYQMVVVQNGKSAAEFKGQYDLLLQGLLEGKPWTQPLPSGPRTLLVRQVSRVEGIIDHPPGAVIKAVQVRVLDTQGTIRATQTLRF
jgi:hypothetical protein